MLSSCVTEGVNSPEKQTKFQSKNWHLHYLTWLKKHVPYYMKLKRFIN